jgi:cytolysin-activating lysine-acyltransferase
MTHVEAYAAAGYALELLAQSPYHRQQKLGDYFQIEILPALSCHQTKFYLTEDGIPFAMVTWAWLSESLEREIHETGRALRAEEWNSGTRLFFNDWISPYNNMREVSQDMACNMFPDETATSLRRNMDGTVRRINRWTGVNRRKKDRSRG